MISIPANDIILFYFIFSQKKKMPNEWKTIKALVHKIRLHGRREKGMAESFNELDVQHEWEEITHTHTRVQRVQAQYTLCNGTCTVRVQIRGRSIHPPGWPCQNFFKKLYMRHKHSTYCAIVKPQYELKHGPIGTQPVLAMINHCTRGTRTVHTVQ